jgi:hypothetical protein
MPLFFRLLTIALMLSMAMLAQEDLITDRPDQTESANTVPRGSIQIETGFVYETNKDDNLDLTNVVNNTTLFRFGLLDNFELRLGLENYSSELKIKSLDLNTEQHGFSPLYTGFKIAIANEDDQGFDLALIGGLNLPLALRKETKEFVYTGADFRFALAHSINEQIGLGYNLGASWDGSSSFPVYFYSAVLGISLIEEAGFFAEVYGEIADNDKQSESNTAMADAGFTYLLMPNLQLDLSGGVGLNEEALDSFISFGVSLRLPE